jgi:RNA-binding protein YlmH
VDKIQLTNHIRDINLKNKMFKVIDRANAVLKGYAVKNTEFLNPFEVKNAVDILNAYTDIKYRVDGGYEGSERSIITMYPYYYDEDDLAESLRFIQVEGNFKFKSVHHRDYLGSILGLGIKREKIGDIIIHENFCQVVVDADICDFLSMNLTRVARNNVRVKEIMRIQIEQTPKEFKDKHTTVSSDRIDCVISGIYDISRQDSMKYIDSDRVHINFEPVNSKSKSVMPGDIISVRGKGRAKIEAIGEPTKKGRLKLSAKIPE